MRDLLMTEQDRENIFQLARLVKKMKINQGKPRLVSQLVNVANNYADPVLLLLGYVELKQDTPMQCSFCEWSGEWSEAVEDACPSCKAVLLLLDAPEGRDDCELNNRLMTN